MFLLSKFQDWQLAANISAVVTAIGVLIGLVALSLTLRQLRADHERSRRENAIELMKYFNSMYGQIGGGMKVQELSRRLGPQAGVLDRREPIVLSKEVAEILPEFEILLSTEEAGDGCVRLNVKDVERLRRVVFQYLNTLEIIAAAYYSGAYDKHIIEAEFRYVFEFDHDSSIAKNFRNKVTTYRSLEKFEREISEKYAISEKPYAA